MFRESMVIDRGRPHHKRLHGELGRLMSYSIAPYLVAFRHVALPAPAIAAIVVLYILSVFFHFISDAQKFYILPAKPSLITDGLYSRLRNPNYLGEIMIYCAYALPSAHWLPFLIVALWSAFFFIPGARAKDKSLSRYPDYAAYRARSWALIPLIW